MIKKLPEFIKSTLFEHGKVVLPINGNSMYPLLNNNDLLTIIPCDESYYIPGHLYVYVSNGSLIVHRLLFFTNKWIYVLGDNNTFIEKINSANIIGRVCMFEKTYVTLILTVLNYIFFPLHKTFLFKYRTKIIRLFTKGGRNEKI